MSSLLMAGTDITDAGLPHLSNMKDLKILDLSRTKITDEGLKHLVVLEGVNHLLLCDCTQLTEAGLMEVAKMKGVLRLSLQGVGLDKQAISRIGAAKPSMFIDR